MKHKSRVICRKATYYEMKDVHLDRRLSNVDILGPISNKVGKEKQPCSFLKHAKSCKIKHGASKL